jgi:hypothetical protein
MARAARRLNVVIPAQAGIQRWRHRPCDWMPAFAGMTIMSHADDS